MELSIILRKKAKFFINRTVIYFSFLLLPIWIQKSQEINQAVHALVMIFYMLFMAGQWYLLGKEIDHRFKIYYRANSSMDRVIYRLLTGNVTFALYFNLISFLPDLITTIFFWATWVVLGFFYSWPTRGKIIQETISSQMGEFRFLDSFEKTLLGMNVVFFLVTIPELPTLQNVEALKLFFDPNETIHPFFWNFLKVNYLPFAKYPNIFRLAWSMHFYFVALSIYLLAFYGVLRYFVSRRLSILGVFGLLSSWTFAKILAHDFDATVATHFSVLWVWALLWVTKSSTYRSGLFLGLIHVYGVMINVSYIFLLPFQLLMLYLLFLKDQTQWFRKQLIKYSLLGTFISIGLVLINWDAVKSIEPISFNSWLLTLWTYVERKGFFFLSTIGIIMVLLFYYFQYWKNEDRPFKYFVSSKRQYNELMLSLALLLIFGWFVDGSTLNFYGMMWPIALFSILPLEWIFHSIYRLRSRRNMIFVIYILICLLDSHFEGRVKIVAQMFTN